MSSKWIILSSLYATLGAVVKISSAISSLCITPCGHSSCYLLSPGSSYGLRGYIGLQRYKKKHTYARKTYFFAPPPCVFPQKALPLHSRSPPSDTDCRSGGIKSSGAPLSACEHRSWRLGDADESANAPPTDNDCDPNGKPEKELELAKVVFRRATARRALTNAVRSARSRRWRDRGYSWF